MSIKRILVPLPGSLKAAGELHVAMSAAKVLGAQVETLFISEPPPIRSGGRGAAEMIRTSYAVGAAATQINWLAEERKQAAQEARRQFNQACGAYGIRILAANEEPGTLPSAAWCETEGAYVEVVLHRAPAFDLIVAASAAVTDSLKNIAEQSLLQTRRPVLLAPTGQESRLTGTAMIAWDESPECWHAVSAALPFLKLARAVQVVSVDRYADKRRVSQAEVLAYLRCHDISATAEVVAPELRSVGDTLLAVADQHDIGLLVMGAYSHSRLRERLLGGATQHVLNKAWARPVLMAH